MLFYALSARPCVDRLPDVKPVRSTRRASFYKGPAFFDLNPVEQVFAKLKADLHKAMARNAGELWYAIAQAIETISETSPQCLRQRWL
jgi:transposase